MDRIGLVFVPGLLCDAMLWRAQVDHLSGVADMAAGIKGSKLEVLEDCGHMSTMERPEQVNQVLRRWLAA